jgi:Ca2+/H+ antiporter
MQPYPTSGQMPEPQPQQPAPNPVQTAVKLMYAGAALSLIGLILGLATVGSLKGDIEKANRKLTPTQVHSAEVVSIVLVIVVGVIAIGLWLWMARASLKGRNWARITGTVLFAIFTLLLLTTLRRPGDAIGLVFSALEWLAGLGAVILLWRRESGEFFSPRTP